MRSLSDTQWSRYFALAKRLQQLPVNRRWRRLRELRRQQRHPSLLSLLELRAGQRPDADRDRSGEQLRQFTLDRPLASGGMGVVYRATQTFTDGVSRKVAVKLIHPQLLLHDPNAALLRFEQEIAALIRLDHRYIAKVYDGGVHAMPETGEQVAFLAMELAPGQPLDDYVKAQGRRRDSADLLALFARLCEAVAYAHRQGVVHRDLKPTNVLVDDTGNPKVIDFGLALTDDSADLRACGGAGTPAYMSPAQLAGNAVPTPADDVYSLGVMLCELLTGRRPSPDDTAVLLADIDDRPRRVVARALAPTPAGRFRDAAALLKALRHCVDRETELSRRERDCRRVVAGKVKAFWIEGVLRHSLHDAVRLELGLEHCPSALEQPWELLVQRPDSAPHPLPPGTRPVELFDAASGQRGGLLLLGEPGAGKTTLLLELARDLLHRADRDPDAPVPAVFHLATWAERRPALIDWLVDELDKRYDQPPGVARACLERGLLLPLLDGLDEVAPAHRAACVAAINAFRRHHGAPPVAVCSRSADYRRLPTRLRSGSAVVIRPLPRHQVDSYLVQAGEPLARLRTDLTTDPQLYELLDTPLMLNVAALAYRRKPLPGRRRADRCGREQLLAAYVDAVFKRRTKSDRYPPDQVVVWLAWLAGALTRHEQSVFYLEWMQPDWLPTRAQQRLVSIGSVMVCGFVFALLLGGFAAGGVSSGLPVTIVLGLASSWAFGAAGFGDQIRPLTRLRCSWPALRRGLAGKLTAALAAGIFSAVNIGWLVDWPVGVAVGGLFGLAFIGFGALDFELQRTDAGHQAVANQGLHRSARTALAGAAVGGLLGALAGGLAGGLDGALFGGAAFALILSLFLGGHTCIQHLLLRILLWTNGDAPLNYVRFLDYAAERILLQKVGGGYLFIHRSLRDYFAELHRTGKPLDR